MGKMKPEDHRGQKAENAEEQHDVSLVTSSDDILMEDAQFTRSAGAGRPVTLGASSQHLRAGRGQGPTTSPHFSSNKVLRYQAAGEPLPESSYLARDDHVFGARAVLEVQDFRQETKKDLAELKGLISSHFNAGDQQLLSNHVTQLQEKLQDVSDEKKRLEKHNKRLKKSYLETQTENDGLKQGIIEIKKQIKALVKGRDRSYLRAGHRSANSKTASDAWLRTHWGELGYKICFLARDLAEKAVSFKLQPKLKELLKLVHPNYLAYLEDDDDKALFLQALLWRSVDHIVFSGKCEAGADPAGHHLKDLQERLTGK